MSTQTVMTRPRSLTSSTLPQNITPLAECDVRTSTLRLLDALDGLSMSLLARKGK